MKRPTFRLLVLSLAMTLSVFALQPRTASAAACPVTTCSTYFTTCSQTGGNVLSFRQVGTCTDSGGTSHKEYLFICTSGSGTCYI